MIGIKAHKGKDYKNLPNKTLKTFATTRYCVSTKYDGNKIFIYKIADSVKFFTSDWHEFGQEILETQLQNYSESSYFAIAEYMHNCDGKLGDRDLSAILTTFRVNFAKGLKNCTRDELKANVQVFDFVPLTINIPDIDTPFIERLSIMKRAIPETSQIRTVVNQVMTGADAMLLKDTFISAGWEGLMLHETGAKFKYKLDGECRVNTIIKIKKRPVVDLECISYEISNEPGIKGLIGSLILKDSKDRTVKVGSGLSIEDRSKPPAFYIGKIVEVSYDRIAKTYVQPVFERLNTDKVEL